MKNIEGLVLGESGLGLADVDSKVFLVRKPITPSRIVPKKRGYG